MGRTYLLKNSSGRSPLTDGKMPCLLRYDWSRPIIAETDLQLCTSITNGIRICHLKLLFHRDEERRPRLPDTINQPITVMPLSRMKKLYSRHA
ncbi:hypothetical protein TNCV_366231 [Trichonephila clavipes]|nr:hypothetical protein TNCV_366231 [Trichonephila clavipes]